METETVSDLKLSKSIKKNKSDKSLKIRLTDRDFEVFGFLLDQKFASLEQIYFRFFDARKAVTDPMPSGLHVTRQRLQLLRQAGFISTQRVYSEPRSLYLLTSLGDHVFRSQRPEAAFLSSPPKAVDFRNYEHDTKVNDCRIAIERTGKIIRWLPEKRLRSQGFESEFSWDDLPKELVPDGIFIPSQGARVAFEIEATPRKKIRYEEKRDGFLSVMHGHKPLIHRVIWTGFSDRVYQDLKDVAGKTDGFIIESYSHFLSKLWPRGIAEKV